MLTDSIGSTSRRERASRESRTDLRSTQALRHRPFHKPVVIERRRVDRDRVVVNTRVALDALLHEWPEMDCPQRMRALKACLAVIRGERPPSSARRAFVTAARAARILREE
ncbi:DUF982 domain-containing protein [Chelativorans sp. AA-79]|uniref:DUF982 domain-containing protein n=1 Tax=Chelativorans sp. AA-79 TaxID=3028735 RepID=UPI0023F8A260|nr:DUF982 domain-containing protein [Chelativorans sp. AA-79]WEX07283.1 DUF982 domain-containing protein [Chelativorans sp. AA-79]